MAISSESKHAHENHRTLRIRIRDVPGKFAEIAEAIGGEGGSLGDIRMVEEHSHYLIRDVGVYYEDYAHLQRILGALDDLKGAKVLDVIDQILEIHRGGKLDVVPKRPIETIADLQMVYTPGVASVCKLIQKQPDLAYELTIKGHTVAVVTNGTAVLGLGDISAIAGLPVMEGKAQILRQLGDVAAFPILIETHDPQVVIETVQRISPGFGAIQLEDIAAPDCFVVEEALDQTLDIPVMHDDQHGTATVVLAGLMKAMRIVEKRPQDVRVVINGAGAAGLAIATILLEWGVQDLIVCDSRGTLCRDDPKLNPYKRRVAERTNAQLLRGDLAAAMRGTDVFIGVSRAGVVSPEMVASMGKGAIVFPLANPVPEIWPSEAVQAGAAIAVDGRSLNNALAFPGLFRGALVARATHINMPMKFAAAGAIADAAKRMTMMPSILNKHVHTHVAEAVARAAVASGVARIVETE